MTFTNTFKRKACRVIAALAVRESGSDEAKLVQAVGEHGADGMTLADLAACFDEPEEKLVKSLLKLHQHAHHNGYPVKDMPPIAMPEVHQEILSAREIEVLVLITKGLINKEIADKLNISLTTVITHRKNITEKLGIKSVSGLTIYAVMNGYIEADRI